MSQPPPLPLGEGSTAATWGADNQRQRIALKSNSPLRGKTEQHDASDLSLFRAADGPGLF